MYETCFVRLNEETSGLLDLFSNHRGHREHRGRQGVIYSAAPHNLFVKLPSLCSAKRLGALCGSIIFIHKEKWTRRQWGNPDWLHQPSSQTQP